MLDREFDQKSSFNEPAERINKTCLSLGEYQPIQKKPTILIGSFALLLAVPTGLGFATRNYLDA